ncbi:MAG: MBL fold metallo-hydrolase [Acetobacteraceae bacterium]|nr:MBL fold metallo-hydrolase [Acetobacteraceae bacterium]
MVGLVRLDQGAYYLPGPANLGVAAAGRRAVAVDTGLDEDRARRLLRALHEEGLELGAVILTHSHADHMGGAAFLASRTGAPVFCSLEERPFVESPVLEGMSLFGGYPPRNLRNKFLLAPPCRVEGVLGPGPALLAGVEVEVVPLLGHSLGHVGVRCGGVLFSGDVYIGRDVLARHGVPFLVEVDAAAATLEGLLASEAAGCLVPGHGQPGPGWREDARANLDRIREVADRVQRLLERPLTSQEASRELCRAYGVRVEAPGQYYLMLSATKAFLTYLFDQGLIGSSVRDGNLLWHRR